MEDICKNCKYFDVNKRMINGSYICLFHNLTVNPNNMGCYMIQKNNKLK